MPMLGACDFLVVAALDVEADAVLRLLEDVETRPSGQQVGYVSKASSDARYCVGLARIGGMGNTNAQAATREAIHAFRPRRVLLVGIAAGFPPRVAYGLSVRCQGRRTGVQAVSGHQALSSQPHGRQELPL